VSDGALSAVGATQRVEGVRGDREPALIVDAGDRLERGQSRRNRLLEPEPDEVTVTRADLLAHHHVHAQLRMRERELAGGAGPADLVVVGDRDDVDAAGGRAHDRLGTLGAVAPDRVRVEIRAPRGNVGSMPSAGRPVRAGSCTERWRHPWRVCGRDVNGRPVRR
jgi:hypothetical protein